MRHRFLIVHNPHAGSGRRKLLDRVIAALEAAGCTISVIEAKSGHDAGAAVRAAVKSGAFGAVVAAGGDGTTRSVAGELRGKDIPVGLLPLGTGNVMAAEIGLPRRAESITDCLRRGTAIPVKGGTANDEPFFLMAGAGIDAQAVANLDMRLKRRIGKLAYVWPVLRAIFAPTPLITARLDGVPHRARWAVMCKSSRYAGGFRLSPDSSIAQPGLIAVLCTARTRLGLIVDILMIGAGYARRAPHLDFVAFRRAHLSADRDVPVQVDGEPFGTLPLKVETDRLPVYICVPANVTTAGRAGDRAAA